MFIFRAWQLWLLTVVFLALGLLVELYLFESAFQRTGALIIILVFWFLFFSRKWNDEREKNAGNVYGDDPSVEGKEKPENNLLQLTTRERKEFGADKSAYHEIAARAWKTVNSLETAKRELNVSEVVCGSIGTLVWAFGDLI